MTTVHSVEDTRVFHKQCRSLAAMGHDVMLVAARPVNETRDGVRIIGVGEPGSRLGRILGSTWRVMKTALAQKPDVFQFHDPELIPVGLMLRFLGRRVVYDIHEDYVTSILQKRYLPGPVRKVVSMLFDGVERLASRAFVCLLAERYYEDRFPHGHHILNYPLTDALPLDADIAPSTRRLIYTGGQSYVRGARIHANLVNLLDDVEVHAIGRCEPGVADAMRGVAGGNGDRLIIEGDGVHVPFQEILRRYREERWGAALALFPPTPHYLRKELTKFYEYMGAGLPIVCSDFPVWKDLIEGIGCGVCVDPEDDQAVATAVEQVLADPEEARRMGERGRAAVRDRFNWDGEAAKLENIYRRALGE